MGGTTRKCRNYLGPGAQICVPACPTSHAFILEYGMDLLCAAACPANAPFFNTTNTGHHQLCSTSCAQLGRSNAPERSFACGSQGSSGFQVTSEGWVILGVILVCCICFSLFVAMLLGRRQRTIITNPLGSPANVRYEMGGQLD